MSELDTLKIRLNYNGGIKAESRMQKDKLRTLKKALLYSYQAATAILKDGREFRCLINPDKLKNDYDNKIISIPFKDICLNSEFLGVPTSLAEEPTNIQVGDVFEWKETETHWLVYLRYLEEDSYFRAEIRKCDSVLSFDNKDYWVYSRGPIETTIKWGQKSNTVWNNINYSAVVYVGADEDTNKLKRFSIVKLNGQNYEVQVVNRITSGGVIVLYLSEHYTNSIEEQFEIEEDDFIEISLIQGKTEVYPFSTETYYVEGGDGEWSVDSSKVSIVEQSEEHLSLEVTSSYSGEFNILYTKANGDVFTLPVKIMPF